VEEVVVPAAALVAKTSQEMLEVVEQVEQVE